MDNSRRKFLQTGSLFAFSVSIFGVSNLYGLNKTLSATDCDETTKDILGPYFRANAPFRNDLRIVGEEGIPIRLGGRVVMNDCTTPVKDALIEVWHANHEGQYDMDTEDYRYYGSLHTKEDGSYHFDTVIPGRYRLGAGVDDFRPSHIHFRVRKEGFKEIISQIYFKDDPYIKNDPWASKPSAELRILEVLEEKENRLVNFDMVLSSESG